MINRLDLIARRSKRYRVILRILHSSFVRILLGLLILMSMSATITQSFKGMAKYQSIFYLIAFVSGLAFTIEYLMRIYSAQALYPEKSVLRARLEYIVSFMGLIDIISILPFTIPYFFRDDRITAEAIEFGRIFLVFKLFRYSKSYLMIKDVLTSVKYELLTSLSFVGIFVSFGAILMYYVEKTAQPDAFKNIGQGFWWAVITFTSVGYGDIYPVTALGKLLTGGMVIIGLIAFALPTAIVSGAFMNYLQEERDKIEEAKKVEESQKSETPEQ